MTVLEIASRIAKPFEGLHRVQSQMVHPYHDPVGYPTIGYGHLLSKNVFEDLSKFQVISFHTAEEILQKDMLHSYYLAIKLSPILSNDENKFRCAAITDFIFNCGSGNYSISTLKKKIDNEEWDEAIIQIQRWNKSRGRVLAGLTRRRKAEAELLSIEN
jgi:lysozyme